MASVSSKYSKVCDICSVEFSTRYIRQRFCSNQCGGLNQRKQVTKNCMMCGVAYQVRKAREETTKFCSISCGSKYRSGENSPNWKKDRSALAKRQNRNDSAYKEWRASVWLRDNFTCKIANPDCKGRIEAHHILPWADFVSLRYEMNNGITLCHFHHPKRREDEYILSSYFSTLVVNET